MSYPHHHAVDISRRGPHWIARCTCGTGAVARRISTLITRFPHEAKPKEAVA